MGLGIFCIDHLNCWLTVWSVAFGVGQKGRICGDCSKYKVSRCDGRRGTFSFSRKIYKLALALVSGTWSKVFQFTQFTMGCECQSKLQICSSERNVPLLPSYRETLYPNQLPHKSVPLKNKRLQTPLLNSNLNDQRKISPIPYKFRKTILQILADILILIPGHT